MRLLSLDALRGLAVLLVLGCHAEWSDNPWFTGGWIGVDLFFVLSGFLVGGILIREVQNTGTIDIRRFWIRRARRIYPGFLAMILFVMAYLTWHGREVRIADALSELLFITNYAGKLCCHTWTLAIEEHFYLVLPPLLLLLRRRLTLLPWVVLTVALVCLAMRFSATWPRGYFATHLRIDSLLFGVLLAYLSPRIMPLVERIRWPLMVGGVAALAPVFFFDQNEYRWMQTIGFTTQYLACGAIILGSVARPWQATWLVRSLAFIGVYSYGIYLWHIPVRFWLTPGQPVWVYMLCSIAAGIAATSLIERPALRSFSWPVPALTPSPFAARIS